MRENWSRCGPSICYVNSSVPYFFVLWSTMILSYVIPIARNYIIMIWEMQTNSMRSHQCSLFWVFWDRPERKWENDNCPWAWIEFDSSVCQTLSNHMLHQSKLFQSAQQLKPLPLDSISRLELQLKLHQAYTCLCVCVWLLQSASAVRSVKQRADNNR